MKFEDMIKDDEIELFIRTYCAFQDCWALERGKSPDPLWPEKSCWWLCTKNYGSLPALDLKLIFKEILRADRKIFHTWKSPAEMRIWFDLNKIAKNSTL